HLVPLSERAHRARRLRDPRLGADPAARELPDVPQRAVHVTDHRRTRRPGALLDGRRGRRMNWRAWWARFRRRERGLIAAAGAVLGLAVLRFALISPFLAYREGLQDEITSHRELLDNDRAYLARAGEVTKHLELLRTRFTEVRSQLVPGDTPTLAA